jgi:aldose 1-epimerase
VYDEVFSYEEPIITDTSASVTTVLHIDSSSPLYASYPFACTLRLTYTVTTESVTVSYTVVNEGNSEMPFGFGLHPYFSKLSGDEQTYITIPAKSWMESPKDTLLPTGILIDVSGKPYNVNTSRPIAELSLDHVYTDLTPHHYATIFYKTIGVTVELKPSEDFTHMVVYTGNAGGVCIENQTCSTNAINLHNRGFAKESHVLVIQPATSHSGHVAYNLSSST